MDDVLTPQESLLGEYNKRIRSDNLANLKEIKKSLNTIFGEEHNQIAEINILPLANKASVDECLTYLIDPDTIKRPHYNITIHFPKITISNTKDLSHEIQDLYVRFSLTGDLTLVLGEFLKGMKTTFTLEEYRASYTHSHLPGICTSFQNFCTGTGPINMQAVQLAKEFSLVKFNMFLHTINLYVRHESLEGVPYRHISNISKPDGEVGSLRISIADYPSMYFELKNDILNNYDLLSFVVTKEGIIVKSSDEFSIKIAEKIDILIHSEGESVFEYLSDYPLMVQRLNDGRYVIPINREPPQVTDETLINFKGKNKTLKIIYDPPTNIDSTRYTHPDLIEYICKQLARKLTKAAFDKQAA